MTTLFDGSSPVNLDAITQQLPGLASARADGSVDDPPAELFCPVVTGLPALNEVEFDLGTGSDAITAG